MTPVALPSAPLVERLGIAAGSVKHQQRPALAFRLQLAISASPRPRLRADGAREASLDFGAVRLIGRRVEAELHGPDDTAAIKRRGRGTGWVENNKFRISHDEPASYAARSSFDATVESALSR